MFRRLLWKLVRGSRGRLAVAMVGLISGAAVISALLNLQLDIQGKLTQEFRSLGANVVIAPHAAVPALDAGASTPVLMNQADLAEKIKQAAGPGVTAVVPFLYIVARTAGAPVVTAGTDLQSLATLQPAWKIDGRWSMDESAAPSCVVGRNAADHLHASPDSLVALEYEGRPQSCTVSGVLDTGGPEDNQIFIDLAVVQRFAELPGGVSLVELNASGAASDVSAAVNRLQAAFPDFDVHPIRQVTAAEGDLLGRIRLLIAATVLLILVLTSLCVLATMAALAMERREDVGLMKALGGSISRVVGLFLAEVGVLGAVGGLLGCLAGVALSRWMGQRVFSTAISPRWQVFPLTVGLMILVALAGALPLRLLGRVKPAVILRGE
ncbi:MAG TPA: ABC transporter permease [Candidatus Limnocylindrales bacterium]|nr:ABC transporter permease [Candidatus Limnocylindrales bacterium]